MVIEEISLVDASAQVALGKVAFAGDVRHQRGGHPHGMSDTARAVLDRAHVSSLRSHRRAIEVVEVEPPTLPRSARQPATLQVERRAADADVAILERRFRSVQPELVRGSCEQSNLLASEALRR